MCAVDKKYIGFLLHQTVANIPVKKKFNKYLIFFLVFTEKNKQIDDGELVIGVLF